MSRAIKISRHVLCSMLIFHFKRKHRAFKNAINFNSMIIGSLDPSGSLVVFVKMPKMAFFEKYNKKRKISQE
jgi:hypothetical protein